MPGKRYSDLQPEQIEKEKSRKRLANRVQWVRRWWPRIEADAKEERGQSELGQ